MAAEVNKQAKMLLGKLIQKSIPDVDSADKLKKTMEEIEGSYTKTPKDHHMSINKHEYSSDKDEIDEIRTQKNLEEIEDSYTKIPKDHHMSTNKHEYSSNKDEIDEIKDEIRTQKNLILILFAVGLLVYLFGK
jgi:E3 ubiquitin-protein ligase DOA10